jgi:hypothetical protein
MITKEVLDVCPFDLDEPTKLWRAGVRVSLPSDHPQYRGPVINICLLLSERDAWEYRARFHEYIREVYGDPAETTLDASLERGRMRGAHSLLIIDALGRAIEVYLL